MQLLEVQRFECLKRAGRISDRLGGNVGVARRRAQLGMPEQNLNNPNVDIGHQQMRREAVA